MNIRSEILSAIHRLIEQTGEHTFTAVQVVEAMQRDGVAYSESTILAYINALEELERVGRGRYRLRPSGG